MDTCPLLLAATVDAGPYHCCNTLFIGVLAVQVIKAAIPAPQEILCVAGLTLITGSAFTCTVTTLLLVITLELVKVPVVYKVKVVDEPGDTTKFGTEAVTPPGLIE